VYNASRLVSGDQSIRLGQYPALQRALTQSNPLVLEPHAPHSLELAQAAQDLDRVYRLLDVEPGGSLLIQSLECASQVFGVLIACRTLEQGPFTTSDRRKSEMLAAHLGTAISNARRFQEIRVRLGQLDVELGAAETRHTRIRTDLENRLTRAEEQATLYMQRLYEAELGEQQAQEDAQEARRKLAALRQEGQADVVHARDELKRSIQQVTYLTQQIANLDAQCLQLGSLVQALEQEKGLLQLRLAVVATEQDAFTADAEPTLVQTPLLSGSDSQTADTWPTDRLIPALVHDLGASLASLLEYAELFANSMSGGLEYRQGELLKRVQASTERLQGMLGNLTSLIAMDGGTPVLKLAPVDVAKVIEVALARAKFRLEDKDLQTRLEIGVLPTLRVDPAYMQQIMDNLVSYACRSSRSGAIISIRAYANAQDSGVRQLHITVSSTDPGSNTELQRADTERRAVVVESQAELLIIRMLVEVHQGQIQFGDELGTSTVVHLTMPIESVQTPEHRGDGRG
jgi:signal transduction histidine kinase